MDTAVKQRLLGGIILITGAAILLPLMLDGSGAKLLGRLEPLPQKPAVATVEQAKPALNQQQLEAEDQIANAHGEDVPFYSLSKPSSEQIAGKTPKQIADELAAKKRTAELFATTEEITPEQAQQQKLEQEQLARDLEKNIASEKLTAPKDIEAEKALAILEAQDTQTQQMAERAVAEKLAKQKEEQLKLEKIKQQKEEEKAQLALAGKIDIDEVNHAKLEAKKRAEEQAKAEKLALEKAEAKQKAEQEAKLDKAEAKKKAEEQAKAEKLAAEKEAKAEKLALEKAEAKQKAEQEAKLEKSEAKKKAEEQAKAEKLAAEKEAKAEKLAKEKAEAKKKEEEKAKLALEGKKDKEDAANNEAWVVQVASVSDKAKADALSGKLAAKGYRSRVVKNGDNWKVVVGPELDKAKAQSLKTKLSSESSLGVSGAWVAPWKP